MTTRNTLTTLLHERPPFVPDAPEVMTALLELRRDRRAPRPA